MNISIMGKDITFCIIITSIKLIGKTYTSHVSSAIEIYSIVVKKNLKSRMNTTLIGLPQHSITSSTQASNNETSAETSLNAYSLINHCEYLLTLMDFT